MLKNYLTVAIRSLYRQKAYTLLNILGLAVGLAGAMLIYAHIRTDLRWDGFHEVGDRIYRLNQLQTISGVEPQHVAYTAPPIADAILNEIPEVVNVTRFLTGGSILIETEDGKKFFEDGIAYVDTSFFAIFSYPLQYGDPSSLLNDPNAIVLDSLLAVRYFGNENPLGKQLLLDNRREVVVTGVLATPPAGTHLHFRLLAPFETAYSDISYLAPARDSWGFNTLTTYLLLAENASVEQVQAKLPEFFAAHRRMDFIEYYLQPLADLHLRSSHVKFEHNNGQTSEQNIRTLFLIGTFLLLLAVINYLNLSTAVAIRRAREVGMRKVVGAKRRQIISQFLGEAFLVTAFSMVGALLLIALLKPHFASLAGREVEFSLLSSGFEASLVLGLTLLVSFLTGLYPAFVLSSFQPVTVLKGRLESHSRGAILRKLLVVVQFATSIILIIATSLVFRQVEYTRQKDLGFDRNNVIVLPLRESRVRERGEEIRDRLALIPGVQAASISVRTPVLGGGQTGVFPEGQENPFMISTYDTDPWQQAVL